MTSVALLFDLENSWIENYLPTSFNFLSGFNFTKIYDANDISNFDLVFVLGYTKILDIRQKDESCQLYLVHESDLPLGKGFAPVQWQILEGKNDIVVSLLELSEHVDSGDIVEQAKINFNGTELYDEIRKKQANATYDLIIKFLEKYPAIEKTPQSGNSTFYRKRRPSDSELDIDKTIRDQFLLLRTCNNSSWPAYFQYRGAKYILKIYKQDENAKE